MLAELSLAFELFSDAFGEAAAATGEAAAEGNCT